MKSGPTRRRHWNYQQIAEGLPAIAAVFTATGKIAYCNRQMLEYLGGTFEEIRARDSAYGFHPEDRGRVLELWATAIESGEPFDCEARLCRADGVYRWHRTRCFPLRNTRGEVQVWYGLSTDIDDLKRAETELRQAYAFLNEAQRLSKTGSYTWDALSNEEIWSDELYRIFEIEPDTRMTWSVVRQRVHPDDVKMIETTNEKGIVGEEPDYFCRIVTPGGMLKHVHVVAHRSELVTDRPVYVGAIQDVTETKLAQEALDRARAELTHMARVTALSALTASIAHEVSQPLAGIMTNASTCLRMLAADPPNLEGAQATAQRTIRDANRASDVIQRLRALFSRKTPGSSQVDLNDAAREVLALSSAELQRSRVILRTDFAEGLAPVCGDRVQLQQVILNLVLNAADALREVEQRPRELWLTTGGADDGCVTLSVRDAGVGIKAEAMENLFDAFFTTKPQGMGIGLSISRSIIESHKGRLWAEPNDGPGATFGFTLPPTDVQAERSAAGSGAWAVAGLG